MQTVMQFYSNGQWIGSVIPEPRYPEDHEPRVRARREGNPYDVLFIGHDAVSRALRYAKGAHVVRAGK